MAKNNSNGIAQGIMVIIFILIYPFVWLYDKLGAGMFWALITILFGGGLAWWGLNTKKKKENENIEFDSLSNNGIYIDLLKTSLEDNTKIISALNKILNKVQTKFIYDYMPESIIIKG